MQTDAQSDGWTRPHPAHSPRPTYWPAGLALGVTTALWGLVASPVVSAMGALVAAVSMAGWVRELVLDDGDPAKEVAHPESEGNNA